MLDGIHFQPKSYFGLPRQQVAWLKQFSPTEQDFINRMLSRVVLGDPTEYGMPAPAAATLAEGATTVNSLLMYWIQHGRIGVRPGISAVDGPTVHFADGSSDEYHSILWATGFNVRLPFLADDLIPWDRGVPLRSPAGILPEGVEQLYFIGLTAPRDRRSRSTAPGPGRDRDDRAHRGGRRRRSRRRGISVRAPRTRGPDRHHPLSLG